jgi:tol-pal system protein YbgF
MKNFSKLLASLLFLLSSVTYAEALVEDVDVFNDEEFGTQLAENDSESALARDSMNTDESVSENVAFVNKMQALQREVQELRGALDVLSHDIKVLQEQQLSFYKDLDDRLQTLKAANTVAKTHSTVDEKAIDDKSVKPELTHANSDTLSAANNISSNPADEQISYLSAYEFIKNKSFDKAIVAMQDFVKRYPDGGYAANAWYWMGEVYLQHKSYNESLAAFNTVMDKFPNSNKYSASMLKIGYVFLGLGHNLEAKTQFENVIKKYPDTDVAKKARTKLLSLGF